MLQAELQIPLNEGNIKYMNIQTNRLIASKLAQKIMNGYISYEQFVDQYPENTGDKDIETLFDLIEHQPKHGDLQGVSQSIYDEYNSKIFKLIKKIEQG